MPPDHWHQHNIDFADHETRQHVLRERLGPALRSAEENGELTDWWFMNKKPLPLRYRAAHPAPSVERLLSDLVGEGLVVSWLPAVYEPETEAFGGPHAMEIAHRLFHADSQHLVTYRPGPGRLRSRECSVLLLSAMLRSAGLDWFEQGDVWAKAAALRPTGAALPPSRTSSLLTAMQKLLTTETRGLCRPGQPLEGQLPWVASFQSAGASLAHLAAHGGLTRGLRAVLAHHVIFHANRAGLPWNDQRHLFHIAREVVMGTTDNTATPAPHSEDESTSAEATQLRNALVDRLQEAGSVSTARVEQALRSTPRHLFVPDAPLSEAYADSPVNIKYDTDGAAISCASQPGVVAMMLNQLDVRPGQRVLEIGAGTGYNAALLAHLTGDQGHVTTIDVDDDLVEGARAHLASAGITNVDVLLRDGAVGHAEGGSYDRIIATVGAHGIPHAWMQQLALGGRLLVPQRLKGSVSRSIAYEQHEGRWVSLNSRMNTFMPLRRGIADDERSIVPLSADGTVRLQTHAGQDIDAAALAGVLDQPRTEEWTGMTVQAMESPEWMELFVACSLPTGLNRMLFPATAKGELLTEDPYPSSTAAVEKGALTYLARRRLERTTPEGGSLWEFGVIGHGPGSDELAAKVADAIRTWDREYRDRQATFEIQPLDAPAVEPLPGLFTIETPLNRIIVDWQ
ncbi:methyltransferase, FxLD system [Streptomyces cellulosae]|uniref:methyltransferase, FxLD system n=1 Tax=Streptomyces sp. P9-2 TaxID=3423201 RepID=UPI00167BE19B|nr:O-methyltransferase [Streptomyces cellulosae]